MLLGEVPVEVLLCVAAAVLAAECDLDRADLHVLENVSSIAATIVIDFIGFERRLQQCLGLLLGGLWWGGPCVLIDNHAVTQRNMAKDS